MNQENKIQITENFRVLKEELDSILGNYQCKGSHLQNYLYFTYAPVFSYTEAIILLCKNGKLNAASSLLRSLVEVHINIIYHQAADSDKRLAISARERFVELRKAFCEISELIKKYPIRESLDKGSLFNELYLVNAIAYIDSNIADITSSNKLDKKDKKESLIEKAKKNDKTKIIGAEDGHFQRMYTMIYRQLSASVHLDVLGLENFSEKNQEGKYSVKERYDEVVLVGEALGICVALAKDLFENKVIATIPKTAHSIESSLLEK